MNVIDLFNTPYERALSEGAVDDLEARYIHGLNTKMLDLMARAKNADPEHKVALKQAYEKIKSERDSFYKIRETKAGQDIVDPKEKMRALTPSKPGVAGAVKDVAKGLKNFLQGKPETGPTYEDQKKKSKKVDETKKDPAHNPLDQRLQRLKVQARREFPRAHNDEEALLLKLLDKETKDAEANRRVDARQDAEIKRNFDFDREQEDEIEDLQAQVGVREHGGGIGPSQRWQDLMPEGWSDKYGGVMRPPTPYSVYIKGKKWKDFSTDDHAQAVANKLKAKFKADGRDPETITIAPTNIDEGVKSSAAATALVACIAAGGTLSGCATNPSVGGAIGTVRDVGTAAKTASTMTRAGVQDELSQELRNFIRAQGGDPGSQNLSLLYKLQKRLQGKKDAPQNINEIKDTEAVEQAILKRIMVAHRDMLMKYGPEKIMTAASDVAYNVGDVGEVGSSDVSGWVKQVEQILGAVNETKTRLDPKCWKGKKIGNPKTKMKGGVRVNNCVPAESVEEDLRDPEDNPCWKGYHPVGTKKKGGKTVPNCVPNAKT